MSVGLPHSRLPVLPKTSLATRPAKKLFDKTQEALIANGKPRKKREPKNFQFLNFAVCGECGYSITAERHIKKSGLKFVYYRCTKKSKTQNCSQTRFLREEILTEQVKEICQKVSLPDNWREKYLAKVNEWKKENRQSSELFAQNLKTELEKVKTKINRLMDAYLEGDLELPEFQLKKNDLMSEKKTLEEKLSDFERKGNHWLELVRNWIIEANQAKNFVLSDNFSEMKNFLKKIGSNRRIFDQRLFVDFKKPWNSFYFLPAEARAPSEARGEEKTNRLMWTQAELNCHLRDATRKGLFMDLPRIELGTVQCECTGMPFTYRPKSLRNIITGFGTK